MLALRIVYYVLVFPSIVILRALIWLGGGWLYAMARRR